ncbi:MAG: DUF1636 domain-containing protein [Rhodospirillaceae bacterium]
MTVEVIVCETCRRKDGEPLDGITAGREFADALRGMLASDADLNGVRLTTMRCLMACGRACTVHLRAPGRMGYVLGDMSSEPDRLHALIAYLRGYVRSSDGVVPYADWPEAIKGRFVSRIPAPPPGND